MGARRPDKKISMILRLILLTSILILLASCTRTIEVPENKVGIVYKKDEVQDVVLESGSHTIGIFSGFSLYDIREQRMDFEFDILSKDVSSADISFSISYIIKVDDLAKICQHYRQPIYYNSLDLIVEIELRRQVRNLLLTFDKGELDEKELFDLIENQLRTKSPAADIIEIKAFSPGRLIIKN